MQVNTVVLPSRNISVSLSLGGNILSPDFRLHKKMSREKKLPIFILSKD